MQPTRKYGILPAFTMLRMVRSEQPQRSAKCLTFKGLLMVKNSEKVSVRPTLRQEPLFSMRGFVDSESAGLQ
jgi:hypothetical protein